MDGLSLLSEGSLLDSTVTDDFGVDFVLNCISPELVVTLVLTSTGGVGILDVTSSVGLPSSSVMVLCVGVLVGGIFVRSLLPLEPSDTEPSEETGDGVDLEVLSSPFSFDPSFVTILLSVVTVSFAEDCFSDFSDIVVGNCDFFVADTCDVTFDKYSF